MSSDILSSWVSSWKRFVPGLKLLAHWSDEKTAVVDFIQVPVSSRRQGIATQALQELMSLADIEGFNILIQPDPSFGTPQKVLFNLYTSLGFEDNGDSSLVYTGKF
jgi:hypothetical protein